MESLSCRCKRKMPENYILSGLRPLRLIIEEGPDGSEQERTSIQFLGRTRFGLHHRNGTFADAVAIRGDLKPDAHRVMDLIESFFEILTTGRSTYLEERKEIRRAQFEFVASWRLGNERGWDRHVVWLNSPEPIDDWDENDLDHLGLGTGSIAIGFETTGNGYVRLAVATNRLGRLIHRIARRLSRDSEGRWGKAVGSDDVLTSQVVRGGSNLRAPYLMRLSGTVFESRFPRRKLLDKNRSGSNGAIDNLKKAKAVSGMRELLDLATTKSRRSPGSIVAEIDKAIGGRLRSKALAESAKFDIDLAMDSATAEKILESDISKGERNIVLLHLNLIIHEENPAMIFIDLSAMALDPTLESKTVSHLLELASTKRRTVYVIGFRSPAATEAWYSQHRFGVTSKSGIRSSDSRKLASWSIDKSDLAPPDDGYGDRIRIAVEGKADVLFFQRLVGLQWADRFVFVWPPEEYNNGRLSQSVGGGWPGVQQYVKLRRLQTETPDLFYGIVDGESLAWNGGMPALLKNSDDLIPFPIANSEGVWCIRHYEIENILLYHGIKSIHRSKGLDKQRVDNIINLSQIELSKMLQLDPWFNYVNHIKSHLRRNSLKSDSVDTIETNSEILRLCPGKEALRQVYEHVFKRDTISSSYEDFERKLMNAVAESPFGDTLRQALINVVGPGRVSVDGIRAAEL